MNKTLIGLGVGAAIGVVGAVRKLIKRNRTATIVPHKPSAQELETFFKMQELQKRKAKMPMEEASASAQKDSDDLVKAAADSLVKKFEADKDQVIEFDLNEMQSRKINANKRTLYKHLHDSIVIDNVVKPQNKGKKLAEDELWEGEVSC